MMKERVKQWSLGPSEITKIMVETESDITLLHIIVFINFTQMCVLLLNLREFLLSSQLNLKWTEQLVKKTSSKTVCEFVSFQICQLHLISDSFLLPRQTLNGLSMLK